MASLAVNSGLFKSLLLPKNHLGARATDNDGGVMGEKERDSVPVSFIYLFITLFFSVHGWWGGGLDGFHTFPPLFPPERPYTNESRWVGGGGDKGSSWRCRICFIKRPLLSLARATYSSGFYMRRTARKTSTRGCSDNPLSCLQWRLSRFFCDDKRRLPDFV